MRAPTEYGKCRECDAPLQQDGPCPHCESRDRVRLAECAITASSSLKAGGLLVISWQEVDRLFSENEYAAALLVAAVNVEFILYENLRRFAPSTALTKASDRVKSAWGEICANHSKKVTLSGLLAAAKHVTQHNRFVLSPTWDPLVGEIEDVRNRIAHERGYFTKLTRLENSDWPESRIRQVLEDAKAFCHGNAT